MIVDQCVCYYHFGQTNGPKNTKKLIISVLRIFHEQVLIKATSSSIVALDVRSILASVRTFFEIGISLSCTVIFSLETQTNSIRRYSMDSTFSKTMMMTHTHIIAKRFILVIRKRFQIHSRTCSNRFFLFHRMNTKRSSHKMGTPSDMPNGSNPSWKYIKRDLLLSRI